MTAAVTPDRSCRAEIIAVGSELLQPPRQDTNSLYITERLSGVGIDVRAKAVVGDSRPELESVLRGAMRRAGLVILTGGLGPTDDDLTRDVVAAVLGVSMREDPAVVERIRQRFATRGAAMPEVNRRQALVPDGAAILENRNGTAPGLWIERADQTLVLLPGPPGELKPMFDRVVDERLAPRVGADRVYRRVLRVCGRTESEVEEAVLPVYGPWTAQPLPIVTTVLTAPAQVELHLSVRAGDEAAAAVRLDGAVGELLAVLGADAFSTDGRTLEDVVGALLRSCGQTVAVAESCTGGLVSSRLTDVSGSSDYVRFNAVCYSNDAKVRWLGVSPATLAAHGAVSEATALEMADGIRAVAEAGIGIGVTGIAGPTGGTEAKPGGTVVVAVTTQDVRVVRTFRFPFTRVRNKQFAAQMALDLVRRVLLRAEPGAAFVVRPPAGGAAR